MASNPATGYVEPSIPIRAGLGLTTLVANSFASFFAPAYTGTSRDITSHGAVAGNSSNNVVTALNTAITASSSGDQVVIPAGTFYALSGAVTLKTGVNIVGVGPTSIIRCKASTTQATLFRALQGRQNIRLTDFVIDKDAAAAAVYQHPIRIGEGSSGGTGFTPCEKIYIARVDVSGFEKYGVLFENVKHGFVWDSAIHGATAWGGLGQGYGINISGPWSEENWIIDVRVGKTGGVMRHGVLVQYSSHNNLIEECVAILHTNDAFDTHGEDEYANEFRYNTADQAIRSHASCSGGSCFPSAFGIGEYGGGTGGVGDHDNSGPNNWVHHNTVLGNWYVGVRVNGGPTNPTLGTIIEYNEIEGCTYGVRCGDSNATVGGGKETEIYNNHIHENSYGIQLVNADNSIVRCNHSVDNSVRNLDVTSACNAAVITDNNFRRGTVTNAGTGGTYTNNVNTSTPLPDPNPCPETATASFATGTGAANNATTVKVATAESLAAAGAGIANNAGKTITRAAGHSSGIGVANNVGKAVSRVAVLSSGTGAVMAGVPRLFTNTEYAFGVGAATNAIPSGVVFAASTPAAGTGSAANAIPAAVSASPTEPGLAIQMGM